MRAPSGLAALEPGREAVETAARVRAGAEGREVPEAVGRDDEAGVVTAGGRVARSQHRSAVGRDSACIAGVVVVGGRWSLIMSAVMGDGRGGIIVDGRSVVMVALLVKVDGRGLVMVPSLVKRAVMVGRIFALGSNKHDCI